MNNGAVPNISIIIRPSLLSYMSFLTTLVVTCINYFAFSIVGIQIAVWHAVLYQVICQ